MLKKNIIQCKIGIPGDVFQSTGSLTCSSRTIDKNYQQIAYRCLSSFEQKVQVNLNQVCLSVRPFLHSILKCLFW